MVSAVHMTWGIYFVSQSMSLSWQTFLMLFIWNVRTLLLWKINQCCHVVDLILSFSSAHVFSVAEGSNFAPSLHQHDEPGSNILIFRIFGLLYRYWSSFLIFTIFEFRIEVEFQIEVSEWTLYDFATSKFVQVYLYVQHWLAKLRHRYWPRINTALPRTRPDQAIACAGFVADLYNHDESWMPYGRSCWIARQTVGQGAVQDVSE